MPTVKSRISLVLAQVIVTLLIYALPVLIPSGFRAWASAWVFLGLWFGFWSLILLWLYLRNPDLFWERMLASTSGRKRWDKIVGPLLYVAVFAWLLFTAFDAGRFHWSPVASWVEVLGALILAASFVLFFLTFRENAYLSPVVRVQEDRGQVVVTSGPYRCLRHPMYAATLVFVLGTPLLLGAWYGILAGPIVALVLAWRAILEERTLKKELPGYEEYMARTRYRLIPLVW
jgi:protein-S-isoprenylcysteine O-methyltransferase Ste14